MNQTKSEQPHDRYSEVREHINALKARNCLIRCVRHHPNYTSQYHTFQVITPQSAGEARDTRCDGGALEVLVRHLDNKKAGRKCNEPWGCRFCDRPDHEAPWL